MGHLTNFPFPEGGQFDLCQARGRAICFELVNEKNIAKRFEQVVRGTKLKLETVMMEPDFSSYYFRLSNKERCIRWVLATLRVIKSVNIFESEAKVKHHSTPFCTGGSTLDSLKIDKLCWHIRCLHDV